MAFSLSFIDLSKVLLIQCTFEYAWQVKLNFLILLHNANITRFGDNVCICKNNIHQSIHCISVTSGNFNTTKRNIMQVYIQH